MREVITRDHDDGEEGELKEEFPVVEPHQARPRIPSASATFHQRKSSYSPTTNSRSPRTPEVTTFEDKPGRFQTKTKISTTSITKEIVYPESPPKPTREVKIRQSYTLDLDEQLEKLKQERTKGVETGRLNDIATSHSINDLRFYDIELAGQKLKSSICDQQCVAD